jgi:hypothetical protein
MPRLEPVIKTVLVESAAQAGTAKAINQITRPIAIAIALQLPSL